MEKVMSVEERIKRAEDIYNRRNGGYSRIVPKVEKRKKGTTKKLIMQIFICLCVYIVFYAVTNRDYIFSEDFRNQVSSFFTEKIKVSEWYTDVKNFFIEKDEMKNKGESTSNMNDENIGGAVEDVKKESAEKENKKEENKREEKIEAKAENLSEQQLMEKEAQEIKEKISFIKPITGRISSTFGWRNPTTVTVPKYHTGLDIAAKEGTVIKSATDGKVIMASSQGDYGNHYQIQIKDIILVYAHCKKLYLKEGDIVKQGQNIAEVGNTGNSTGPHLHFEIRKGDKKIDPQLILNF